MAEQTESQESEWLEQLRQELLAPKEIEGDAGRVQRRDVKDMIAGLEFLEKRKPALGGGLRFFRFEQR